MSRAINLPSQSVKLTNVATVRLTVAGKRFEVACYKNKVLDYRAGLETDLSEVLQTSSVHVFTNVAKGEFAAAADLHRAFGEAATQEEIAVQILQRGKSLQVSEAERAQLYESSLTQIATQIAANCVNPGTGKPYTASQIKHALLTHQHHQNSAAAGGGSGGGGGDDGGGGGSKGKKAKHKDKHSKKQQHHQLSFAVQPHKPIKQQYLQALKYLQAAEILPIQRASMELQWQYDPTQEEAVTAALRQLDITTTTTTAVATPPPPQQRQQHKQQGPSDDSAEKTAAATTTTSCTRTFTVDPSVYRPLQELADTTVPGSRLEILRQQVFQASSSAFVAGGHSGGNKVPGADKGEAGAEQHDEDDGGSDDDSDDEKLDERALKEKESESDSDDFVAQLRKKTQRKAKKKHQKKAQRRRVQQHSDSDSDDEDSEGNGGGDEPVSAKNEAHAAVKDEIVTQHIALPPDRVTGANDSNKGDEAVEETKFTCNTCVGASNSFATQSDYRAHFRSDWHRFNQKLKLQGAGAVSLQEFEQCDSESFFATNLEN